MLCHVLGIALVGLGIAGLCPGGTSDAVAQALPREAEANRPEIRIGTELPAAALQRVEALNFKNADLRDVFRALAERSGLNLLVDDGIERRVTVALRDISVLEALRFLAEEYELSLVQTGPVFRVRRPPPPPPPAPPLPREIPVVVDGGLVTADFRSDDVGRVVRTLAEASGETILLRQGTTGTVSGLLQGVPFEAGLRTLLESNGFAIREEGGVYVVERGFLSGPEEEPVPNTYVRVDSTGVELRLQDADAARALRELARQSGNGIVTYTLPEGRRVTAVAAGLSVQEALAVILRGTGVAFRRQGDVYVVGSRSEDGIQATELLRLGYTRVDGVIDLIPEALKQQASIRVVPEQNGLLVTGSNDAIAEVAAFLAALDFPAPQILIEALVVDVFDTDAFRLGLTFGRGGFGADSTSRVASGYRLDGLGTGGYVLQGGGRKGNTYIDRLRDLFGIGSIGRLPPDFYFRIEALAQEGLIEIRSRPQLATLSGNTASLAIGTTQYFILETETPYASPSQVVTQTTQRFEKIEANVSLQITPFVSPTGEITASIKPEFSTPVGEFSAEVPPTISTRVIESMVRLRDGETIILGGLVSEEEVVTYNKVPILGDIPVLGWLFRSRVRSKQRSELVIYLTPHVFYGDERDDAKWRDLAERMGLSTEGVYMDPDAQERKRW